jgi:hypothetical protein
VVVFDATLIWWGIRARLVRTASAAGSSPHRITPGTEPRSLNGREDPMPYLKLPAKALRRAAKAAILCTCTVVLSTALVMCAIVLPFTLSARPATPAAQRDGWTCDALAINTMDLPSGLLLTHRRDRGNGFTRVRWEQTGLYLQVRSDALTSATCRPLEEPPAEVCEVLVSDAAWSDSTALPRGASVHRRFDYDGLAFGELSVGRMGSVAADAIGNCVPEQILPGASSVVLCADIYAVTDGGLALVPALTRVTSTAIRGPGLAGSRLVDPDGTPLGESASSTVARARCPQ